MFWTKAFLAGCFIFFFALKNMVTISTVLDALNFFLLVLTAASKFLTQDCSRAPNGRKEMSLFLVVSFNHMNPEFSANLETLLYVLFHFFYAGFNSWWLYAVTVGGIEKKVRLTMGICSIVLLG
jgi:hypothetical protein